VCGIIGYIGKRPAFPILLSGLKRLEYRGYDSFGFFVLDKKTPFLFKKKGKISKAEKKLSDLKINGNIGIAHTRWGTTGLITDENAHPHFDCQKNIFLVHNGIIENYKELKEKLKKEGHKFTSQTDTEVLCHLIEKYFKGNLEEATRKALREVRGTYGIAVMSKKDPQKIVAARLSSPIILGINNNEFLIASDPAAIITHTRQIINLDDNEIAVLKPDNFFILKEKTPEAIEWTQAQVEKGGYSHFMLKEIMEEPETIENAIRGRIIVEEGAVKLGGLDDVKDKLKKIKRLIIIACGTSYYAAMIGRYMLEEYAGIPTEVDFGSEFRYRKSIFDKNTAAIFLSQSGETADTLAALRETKKKGILTLGITNIVGSGQARETDAGVYTMSGPEIAVASTKTFIGQLAILALFTIFFGRQRDMSLITGKRIIKELKRLPDLARDILKKEKIIKELAEKYCQFSNFIYLGRKYNYPIALEGALKLKEISYLHAEGYSGGEMKHGPLALANKKFPFFVISPLDSVYEKMISNIEEVKVRKAPILAIATIEDKKIKDITDDVVYIPKTLEMLTPILSVLPLHLFAYYMAVLKGYDVDKPRNLAKSVTVE